MGQRLNIEIVKNGDVLANCYYHWSGFSNCAINLALEIISKFDYIKEFKLEDPVKNTDLLFAIRLLEETGAGVANIEETKEILGNEFIKLHKCNNRNDGIIGIKKEDIEDTRYWEEGRVTIDIEKKTLDFDVIEKHDSLEELIENYGLEEEKVEINEVNVNFKEISFEYSFDLKAFIDKANYNEQYYFHNINDDKYFSLIL